MAVLELYAEIGGDGGCLLFTLDPPGLLARGASLEEALAAAPAEATRLRRLLAGGGLLGFLKEPWAEGERSEFVIAETVTGRHAVANGGTKVTFMRDLIPVRRDEVPGFLAVMKLVRDGLWTLKDRIPPEAYGFKSLPRRGTIEEQLRHVASCDLWYLTRLWDDLPRLPRSTDVWHKLVLNRERALSKLGNLSDAELALECKIDHQIWTTRKLFRRFLYHEKFHWDTIERDLSLYLAADRALSGTSHQG